MDGVLATVVKRFTALPSTFREPTAISQVPSRRHLEMFGDLYNDVSSLLDAVSLRCPF